MIDDTIQLYKTYIFTNKSNLTLTIILSIFIYLRRLSVIADIIFVHLLIERYPINQPINQSVHINKKVRFSVPRPWLVWLFLYFNYNLANAMERCKFGLVDLWVN